MDEQKTVIKLDLSVAETSLKEVMAHFAVKLAALITDVTDPLMR